LVVKLPGYNSESGTFPLFSTVVPSTTSVSSQLAGAFVIGFPQNVRYKVYSIGVPPGVAVTPRNFGVAALALQTLVTVIVTNAVA
jgi:hypothetical protein